MTKQSPPNEDEPREGSQPVAPARHTVSADHIAPVAARRESAIKPAASQAAKQNVRPKLPPADAKGMREQIRRMGSSLFLFLFSGKESLSADALREYLMRLCGRRNGTEGGRI